MKYYITIFILLFSIKIISEYNQNILVIKIITPIVTMVSLLVVISRYYNKFNSKSNYLLIAFILLALMGDIAMTIFESTITGLIFFALSHVILISILLFKIHSFKGLLVPITALLLFVMIILYQKFTGLNEILTKAIPVYIALAIASVVLSFEYFLENNKRGLIPMTGIVLFFISDIILGIFNFWIPIPNEGFYIWLAYGPGIFLIALTL